MPVYPESPSIADAGSLVPTGDKMPPEVSDSCLFSLPMCIGESGAIVISNTIKKVHGHFKCEFTPTIILKHALRQNTCEIQ